MSTLPAFEVTYDYLCPFARIAHEHLVAGLRAGAGWDVTFTPWTLLQGHKEDGAPDVWVDPARADDLVALEAGLAVRDCWPERFLDVHIALFRARHDRSMRLVGREDVAAVLREEGLDPDEVFEVVDGGAARKEIASSWRRLVEDHESFGVPTFVVDDDAVFVRLMELPVDDGDATRTIERIVSLIVDHPAINEFKHTTISR
jgi:hypothetical protein